MKKRLIVSVIVFILLILIIISGCAHNGDTKQVCVNSESQPYNACHYVDGRCLSWSTTCERDGGRRVCTQVCQDREQREVCGTEYRDVCTEYELRYYCESQKQWVTEFEFNNNCAAPAKKVVKKAKKAKKVKKAKKAVKTEEAPSGDPAQGDASTPQ